MMCTVVSFLRYSLRDQLRDQVKCKKHTYWSAVIFHVGRERRELQESRVRHGKRSR